MPHWLTRNLILVSATSLLTDVSSEMVYPLLPLFLVGALHAPKGVIGLIEGVAECLANVIRVFAGAWSDRLGRRKPVTIAGYSCSALARILVALAHAWPMVFAGRIVDRFGKGIRSAPRDALIAESVQPEFRGRAFGFHRSMDTLGAIVGGIIAYWFVRQGSDGIRTVFVWAIVPGALGVASLALIREPPTKVVPRERVHPWRAWSGLHPRLRLFLVITALFAIGNSSNQFLLLRASGLGFSDANVVLLYLLFNVADFVAAYPAGAISDRVGRPRLLVLGYAVHALAYLGFGACVYLAPQAARFSIWILFPFYGLYKGLSEGVEKALLSDLAPPDQRAGILGLHATIVGLALLPASLLAGLLWDHASPQAPFALGAATGILAAIAVATMLPSLRKS